LIGFEIIIGAAICLINHLVCGGGFNLSAILVFSSYLVLRQGLEDEWGDKGVFLSLISICVFYLLFVYLDMNNVDVKAPTRVLLSMFTLVTVLGLFLWRARCRRIMVTGKREHLISHSVE
jgi:hypothetical protein